VIYFTFAFVPIFIVFAALMIDPSLGKLLSAEDAREMQSILPSFILGHTPMWVQVLFFGALLSAILSTASGAIIAPTSLCTENIIRPLYPHMSDRQFLLTLRVVLVSFTLAALLFALNSKQTMYDMVQNAYTVTLVAALVPLAAGIFWKRANNTGAMLSSGFGLVAWLIAVFTAPDATVPPALVGLGFSIVGMVMGGLVPRERAAPHPHHGSSSLGARRREGRTCRFPLFAHRPRGLPAADGVRVALSSRRMARACGLALRIPCRGMAATLRQPLRHERERAGLHAARVAGRGCALSAHSRARGIRDCGRRGCCAFRAP